MHCMSEGHFPAPWAKMNMHFSVTISQKGVHLYYFDFLLRGDEGCSPASILKGESFILSFSASFSAFFLSSSACLMFSSCARRNIVTTGNNINFSRKINHHCILPLILSITIQQYLPERSFSHSF